MAHAQREEPRKKKASHHVESQPERSGRTRAAGVYEYPARTLAKTQSCIPVRCVHIIASPTHPMTRTHYICRIELLLLIIIYMMPGIYEASAAARASASVISGVGVEM